MGTCPCCGEPEVQIEDDLWQCANCEEVGLVLLLTEPAALCCEN